MPGGPRPEILLIVLVYLALVLAVGAWAARRTRSARDFFIAGQGIGLLVTGMATMSAAFSGFVFIGGPGLTYRLGLAALFIVVPVGFTAGMLCWVVAKRLRLLAEVREVYTVPDAILARYGSRTASGLASLGVLIGTVGYLGAQLLALGLVIEAVFGLGRLLGPWSLAAAMAGGALVVLAYAVAGGMVAGVYTDLLQGLLMAAAAAGVFHYSMASGGGLEMISRRIVQSDLFGPAFLDPLGHVPVATAMGFFFLFSVGTLGQPHMLHKFYMLDDPRKLKWMPLVVGLAQSCCLLIWVGIGLAVPALVAGGRLAPLDNPDHATPLFLLHHTPELLAGIAFAGILAAIMSTADSFMNIGAAALVRDLPKALGFRVARELRWGRVAVVGLTVAAGLFAYHYGDLVALLGTFAFGTFAAALAPAVAVGLNWRRVTAAAAIASIATGLGLNLLLELGIRQGWMPDLSGALPAAVALAASFGVLFLVTLSTSKGEGEPIAADVAAVMEI